MIGGQKAAAAALLISVFIAGALGGVVGTKLMDRRSWRDGMVRSGHMERPGGRPSRMKGMEGGADPRGLMPMWFSDRLAHELDLDEEQREIIQNILESRRERADDILEKVGPTLKAELDSMSIEIRAILTPDQQLLFDQFHERERERMFRRMSNPMRGPPSGSTP